MAEVKMDGPYRPLRTTGEDKLYRLKGVLFDSTKIPEHIWEDLKNFKVRSDDIFIATVPRSGTHWLVEMVLLIVADAEPSKVNRATMDMLFETTFKSNPNLPSEAGYKLVEQWSTSQPRVISTHLTADLLPSEVWHVEGVKVLTMVRNPLAIFVSQHNLWSSNLLPEAIRKWPDFIQYNMTDNVFGGSWFHHVLSYWSKRHFKDKMLMLKYEDAHRDLRRTVESIAALLQRPLSADQLDRVVELTAFSGMMKTYHQMEKTDPENVYRTRLLGMAPFLDKGKVGNWKGKYTSKQLEQIKSKIDESFGGTGLNIDFEI